MSNVFQFYLKHLHGIFVKILNVEEVFRPRLCTLELRPAQVKDSGIFYFSVIGIAGGER